MEFSGRHYGGVKRSHMGNRYGQASSGTPFLDDKHDAIVNVHAVPTAGDGQLNEETRYATRSKPAKNDWFLFEVAGVLGSLVCLGAILGLLASLNDKPQPDWAKHMCVGKAQWRKCATVSVAVNSVISWLSTLAKLLVLLPSTRGLAQLKWVWFAEEPRQLKDMEAFESASRGLTGSAQLLWKLKGVNIAAVGALATVLSLGFDPFIQNLVTYGTQTHVNSTEIAYLANATTYDVGTTFGMAFGKTADVDPAIKSNIYASIFATDSSQSWAVPMFSCPSGNCNYDLVASLGVCAKCTDLSAKVKHQCTTDQYTITSCDAWLPNGLHLNGDDPLGGVNNVMTIQDIRSTVNPITYGNYSWPLLISESIAAYDTEVLNGSSTLVANECVLNACVSVYNANVSVSGQATATGTTSSQYSEQVLKVFDNFKWSDGINSDLILEVPADTQLGIAQARTFTIPASTNMALTLYLTNHFTGLVHTGPAQTGWTYSDASNSTSDLMQAIYQNQNLACFAENPKDKIACAMQHAALAMTKSMRDAAVIGVDKSVQATQFTGKGLATGQVLSPVVFIYVQWQWIALPALIWIMSCVMLAGTAWKTRRTGVRTWTSNPLALVFLGLDHDATEKAKQHGTSTEALVKKAEDLKVQLHIGDYEAKLVSA